MLETMHRDINAKLVADAHFLNRCIVSLTFYADAPSEIGESFPSLLSMEGQKALGFHQNILICVLKMRECLNGLE